MFLPATPSSGEIVCTLLLSALTSTASFPPVTLFCFEHLKWTFEVDRLIVNNSVLHLIAVAYSPGVAGVLSR